MITGSCYHRKSAIWQLFPILLAGAFLCGAKGVLAAEPPGAKSNVLRLDPKKNTDFAVALCNDLAGNLWMGTEDSGVWRRDAAGTWTQYAVKDGLGDPNGYALAVDHVGRIWVGHLNHGVSVFNGQKWQNYGVIDGPLGERVFAISVSPVDGDVWMATNAGLTRYQVKTDTWKHYTRANGLPSNQLAALALDSLGNIYLGTQCEGLAIGKPGDDYRTWQLVRRPKDTGPDIFPNTLAGSGLPSNLITDVLVADDDIVYVATTCGLARSADFGETWSYIRGADWEKKCLGLYKPLKPEHPKENFDRELLREDYVTNLAEDERGLLWIGYRQRGYEIRRPLVDRVPFISAKRQDDQFPYVSTLLPQPDGTAVIATYGDGLILSEPAPAFAATKEEQQRAEERRGWKKAQASNTPARLPRSCGVPTLEELKSLLNEVQRANQANSVVGDFQVVPFDDDWTTQGDWLGRYGRHWAYLCGMFAPGSYVWGAGKTSIDHWMGIHPQQRRDGLRKWVHWLKTDNPKVLEMPPVYADSRLAKGLATEKQLRRQSEIDDHGEAFPLTKEGPNIYVSLRIPRGRWILSFYNHNKDGHSSMNRMRDYRISIRQRPNWTALSNLDGFDNWAELSRGRQRDFWGGVYQKFLVQGPQNLSIEYAKNNSYNTILAGIFLDSVDEEPEPYFQTRKETVLDIEPQSKDSGLVTQIWAELIKAKEKNPQWWATENRRFAVALLRWNLEAKMRTTAPGMPRITQRIGSGYYALNQFPQWETLQKTRGLISARDIEKSLKWDGKSNYNGQGRISVLRALSASAVRDSTKSLPSVEAR